MPKPTPEHKVCPFCADDKNLELCLNMDHIIGVRCVKCNKTYPPEKFGLTYLSRIKRRKEVAH